MLSGRASVRANTKNEGDRMPISSTKHVGLQTAILYFQNMTGI